MEDLKIGDAIPETFKTWLRADQTAVNRWRKEAKRDFDFRDNDPWSDDDKQELEDQGRPAINMNRCGVIVDAVCGAEIANRQEVRFIPRETPRQKKARVADMKQKMLQAMQGGAPPPMGHNMPPEDEISDAIAGDLYTEASRWARDRADADENDTEAFRDSVTCGIGCTETRIDFEENPDGDLRDDHTDIFEMLWDCNARKRNIKDATRIWHVRKLPIGEARALVKKDDGSDYLDEELHASWAEGAIWTGDEDPHSSEPVRDRTSGMPLDPDGEMEEVIIVRCMWIEREPVWRVIMPDGNRVNMTEADFAKAKENLGEDADKIIKALKEGGVKQTRKVRKQAWLGNVVLKAMPTPCPTQFPFQFITAKRHQTKRMWYGLVRTARDPQEWSNKFFSQILDIINSTAKGGIMAERGTFFENDNDAEETWTSQKDITWIKSGALAAANPRWAQKPQATLPQGLQWLFEVATSSVRDTTGISLEMLGLVEQAQAGILEYQRRQSGMTILQPFFDSLKSYRKDQGELILWFLQNDLSDGRLIRVLGEDDAPYVPLLKDVSLEYDLIIDDMPTSPNQKEMVAQVVMQLLPILKEIAPALVPKLMKYLPLPSKLSAELDEMVEEQQSGPLAQLQERMVMLEARMAEAKVAGEEADVFKTKAETAKIMGEIGQQQGSDPRTEAMLAARKQDIDAGIQQRRVDGDLAIRAANFQADNERSDRRLEMEMGIDETAADNKAELEAWKAAQDIEIKRERAEAQERATSDK